jgi:hypothetical protein
MSTQLSVLELMQSGLSTDDLASYSDDDYFSHFYASVQVGVV